MLWKQKDSNGIELLKKSWSYVLQKPKLMIYALLLIVNTLLCFTIFFLFEYHLFGIHMFDIKTLENLTVSGIFGHISHFFSILLIILFSIFSSLFIRASMNYAVINDLTQHSIGVSSSIMYTAHHLYKLFFLSLIFLNHHIIMLFDTLAISPFLTKLQNNVEGQKYNPPTVSKSMLGSLIVPVFLLSKTNNLQQALAESKRLLEEHFGDHHESSTSFTLVKIILFSVAGIAIAISAPFDEIDTLATSFIAGFILLLLLRIIEVGLIIYHGCLYSYCKEKSSGPFSKEELARFL